MIIFGHRSTHLKSAQLRNVKCPNCETQDQMTASVYGRHVHIFWIPIFPAGKTGVFECQHCHKGFKKKGLGEDGKLAYKNFKSTVKTPLWKYSGLAIIALLICWGFYASKQKDNRVAELVKQPAMFDKYTFKTETGYFSTFKVVEVFQDSMYINYNNYETDRRTGVDDIDLKKNYSDEIYVLTNKDILSMHNRGDIEDIERK
ncbi:hypothetical protein [uncultured Croceitalea sp.]|uniref:hypothetical protein n=1 Tax=uncultured Croceitalea sp. TaxID=1798908 RepID=UPI003305DACD